MFSNVGSSRLAIARAIAFAKVSETNLSYVSLFRAVRLDVAVLKEFQFIDAPRFTIR